MHTWYTAELDRGCSTRVTQLCDPLSGLRQMDLNCNNSELHIRACVPSRIMSSSYQSIYVSHLVPDGIIEMATGTQRYL